MSNSRHKPRTTTFQKAEAVAKQEEKTSGVSSNPLPTATGLTETEQALARLFNGPNAPLLGTQGMQKFDQDLTATQKRIIEQLFNKLKFQKGMEFKKFLKQGDRAYVIHNIISKEKKPPAHAFKELNEWCDKIMGWLYLALTTPDTILNSTDLKNLENNINQLVAKPAASAGGTAGHTSSAEKKEDKVEPILVDIAVQLGSIFRSFTYKDNEDIALNEEIKAAVGKEMKEDDERYPERIAQEFYERKVNQLNEIKQKLAVQETKIRELIQDFTTKPDMVPIANQESRAKGLLVQCKLLAKRINDATVALAEIRKKPKKSPPKNLNKNDIVTEVTNLQIRLNYIELSNHYQKLTLLARHSSSAFNKRMAYQAIYEYFYPLADAAIQELARLKKQHSAATGNNAHARFLLNKLPNPENLNLLKLPSDDENVPDASQPNSIYHFGNQALIPPTNNIEDHLNVNLEKIKTKQFSPDEITGIPKGCSHPVTKTNFRVTEIPLGDDRTVASVERYEAGDIFISQSHLLDILKEGEDLKPWAAETIHRFFAAAPAGTEKVIFKDAYKPEQLRAMIRYCDFMGYQYEIGEMQILRVMADEDKLDVSDAEVKRQISEYLSPRLTAALKKEARKGQRDWKAWADSGPGSFYSNEAWQEWLDQPDTQNNHPQLPILGVIKHDHLVRAVGAQHFVAQQLKSPVSVAGATAGALLPPGVPKSPAATKTPPKPIFFPKAPETDNGRGALFKDIREKLDEFRAKAKARNKNKNPL